MKSFGIKLLFVFFFSYLSFALHAAQLSSEEEDQVPVIEGKVTEGNGFTANTLNGKQAIDFFHDSLDAIAAQNGMSVQKLVDMLLKDETLHLDKRGNLLYIDSFSD